MVDWRCSGPPQARVRSLIGSGVLAGFPFCVARTARKNSLVRPGRERVTTGRASKSQGGGCIGAHCACMFTFHQPCARLIRGTACQHIYVRAACTVSLFPRFSRNTFHDALLFTVVALRMRMGEEGRSPRALEFIRPNSSHVIE